MSKIIETIINSGNLAAPQVLRRFIRSTTGSGDKSMVKIKQKHLRNALAGKRGFGLNEVIGIAAGIIIAAAVVIPGLQTFAGTVMTQLTTWWSEMSSGIFTTTPTV